MPSPFVVGRPLQANELIFGRESQLRFIGEKVARGSSVSLIGERRMGKASVLNHFQGHLGTYCRVASGPPIALARLDLKSGIDTASRFYGLAMRQWLALIAPDDLVANTRLASLKKELAARPDLKLDDFDAALDQLRADASVARRPVLLVANFEHLLGERIRSGFPAPDFFDNLHALQTAGKLVLVVASRQRLSEYFKDPKTGGMTSTFPGGFEPIALTPLSTEEADELLAQSSDYALLAEDFALARQWAGGSPCRLQAAGQALYERWSQRRASDWAHTRYREIASVSCFVRDSSPNTFGGFTRAVNTSLGTISNAVDAVNQGYNALKKQWIGIVVVVAVIVMLTLVLLGYLPIDDLWRGVLNALGWRSQGSTPTAVPGR